MCLFTSSFWWNETAVVLSRYGRLCKRDQPQLCFHTFITHLHFSRLHHHTSNHGKILLSFGQTVNILWLSRVERCYWMFPMIHRHFTDISLRFHARSCLLKLQKKLTFTWIYILASWKCSHSRNPENQRTKELSFHLLFFYSLLSRQNIFTAKHTSQQLIF